MRKLPMLVSPTITPLFHDCESPWCFPHLRGVGSGYNAGVKNRVRGHTRTISTGRKAAFACVMLLIALAWGVSVRAHVTGGDSLAYIHGAESLVAGRGFARPDGEAITHWPPGYSFFLSVPVSLGIGTVDAAMILNGFALVAMIALLWRIIDAPLPARIALIGFCLWPIKGAFMWVLSEGVCFPFMLAALFATNNYVKRQDKQQLAIAAVCMGLCFIMRHVAGAFIAAACLYLLLHRHLLASIVLGFLSSIPAVAWAVYQRLTVGVFTDRVTAFAPMTGADAEYFLWQTAGAYVPTWGMSHVAVAIVTACLLIAAMVFVTLRWRVWMPSAIYPMTACLYMALLVVARLWYDPLILFDMRTTAPALFLLGLSVTNSLMNRPN